MHFHLPKPLHGWRAFIGEVGVIVLGVLIALAAGQAVDTLQWHNKIDDAEAAMRLELAEDDGPQAYARVAIAPCLDRQVTRIHDQAGHVPAAQLNQWIAAYNPPIRTWDSEAWKAVLASDVGSHMGAERLIAWSSPYRLLPMLSEANQKERELTMELREALPPSGEPSPSDLQAVRRLARQLRYFNSKFATASPLVLARTEANGGHIAATTKDALLTKARSIYGNCVTVPNTHVGALQDIDADLQGPPAALNGR
jgi:hypothetical protein